jgi:hypothetical protein
MMLHQPVIDKYDERAERHTVKESIDDVRCDDRKDFR